MTVPVKLGAPVVYYRAQKCYGEASEPLRPVLNRFQPSNSRPLSVRAASVPAAAAVAV